MTTKPERPVSVIRKLIVPFIFSVLLGGFIFYGSEAYQIMGLAALENTIVIFGYAIGIAEFLILAVLLRRIVQYIFLDHLLAKALGAPTPRLLSQMSSVIIYALAIAAIVSFVFKKDLTVVLATFGGASIVVGLALQGMIQDLFAGLTINLDRSINIGDYIRISKGGRGLDIEGQVREISWRATQIFDPDGNMILVPNSQMYSGILVNYSSPDNFFEVEILVTLDAEIPTRQAIRLLQTATLEAALKFTPSDAPEPCVAINRITLQGVEYGIYVFLTADNRWDGIDVVQQQVLRHLSFAGLAPAREKRERREHEVEIGDHIRATRFANLNTVRCARLLGKTSLFQDLPQAELELLTHTAEVHYLNPDDIVARGGEIANVMFFVVEGLLVAEEWRKRIGRKSDTLPSKILGPGNLVSGTAMLVGGSYDSTIRAKTEVLLCEINYHTIEKLLLQNSDCATYLSRRAAEQLSCDISQGTNDYFQQEGIINNIENLTALVFKNLRRSYAHLKLT